MKFQVHSSLSLQVALPMVTRVLENAKFRGRDSVYGYGTKTMSCKVDVLGSSILDSWYITLRNVI